MWRDFRKQTDRQNVLRKGRTLITLSHAMRREYLKHNFDENYVQCIPHPAELSHLNGKVIPAEPWRLLFSGRMENLKGGSLLIAALPKASTQLGRKLSLVFAGGGRAQSEWQNNAQQQMSKFKSVEITFRGWLEPEELQDLYLQTDLVVMPSIWPEPLGLGALEAAQQQIPAVAFNVGGISEWLQDGHNGCLAGGDPPTASGLADAIVRSLADPAKYKRLCNGAREIACSFTMQNHLSRLTDIFRHATQYRKPA
jgi:glycosyltransferase involved in cell wall biosynthesis